jgi:hypothetical protein
MKRHLVSSISRTRLLTRPDVKSADMKVMRRGGRKRRYIKDKVAYLTRRKVYRYEGSMRRGMEEGGGRKYIKDKNAHQT